MTPPAQPVIPDPNLMNFFFHYNNISIPIIPITGYSLLDSSGLAGPSTSNPPMDLSPTMDVSPTMDGLKQGKNNFQFAE